MAVAKRDQYGIVTLLDIEPPDATEVLVAVDVLRALIDRANVATVFERGIGGPIASALDQQRTALGDILHEQYEVKRSFCDGKPVGYDEGYLDALDHAEQIVRGEVDAEDD